MKTFTKSLTVLLGLSAFGFTSYVLYLFLKKNDEDDFMEGYTHKTNHKTLEIKIPKDVVRGLIGRNGGNIKQLQERSETKINFKDVEGMEEKVCVIKGSGAACDIAYNLIQDFINNQPILESVDLWVPVGCVKNIIGRCGEKIFEIRSLSGAKLNVVSEDKTAVAMRIIIKGTKEQINVAQSLIEDVVQQSQHNQQVIYDSLSKREPRVPSKSPEVKKIDSPKCERISPLPGQPDGQFEVYVSAIENPAKFWLQIVGPKATQLDCLVEEMTEYYKKVDNRSQHILSTVDPGDLVAAIFQHDNQWYRAEVLETEQKEDEKLAKLLYIDYGDIAIVPCKDLYELRTDFLRLHFQAIECFLARVDPVGDSWSEEAIDLFEELSRVAQWEKLSAKINGYSIKEKTRAKREGSPVPGIDLYYVTDKQDIDIAQEMVKAGYAVFKKGSDLKSSSRTTSNSNISVASST